MEFFHKTTRIDFLGIQKWAALTSITLFIASMSALFALGLNWGLDFTGGTQIQISYSHPAPLEEIRHKLAAAGFHEPVVQAYGNANTALIRIGEKPGHSHQQISQETRQALPDAKVLSSEYIGPQVGSELATNGLLALIVAMLATMVYIAIRFEWRFAVSAMVALFHDPILILGIFSFWHIEFDLIALAAILSVIGYSLNDTIVVFDRIRENFRRHRNATTTEIVNLSVNQTLSRTIMTSVVTLLAVVALYLFGGEKVHGFSFALIIGIVVGTYSSIYIAGALAVALGLERTNLLPVQREAVDENP